VKLTLAAVTIAVSLWLPGCFAQTGASLTIDAAMTRGPATAPVTRTRRRSVRPSPSSSEAAVASGVSRSGTARGIVMAA